MAAPRVVVVDGKTGRIRGASASAADLLGDNVDQSCHLTMTRTARGLELCRRSCPVRESESPDTVSQIGCIRGERCRFECTPVGADIVVTIDAATPQPPHVHLTEREVEVLRLVSEGFTSKETARILAVGFPTVRTHMENIRRKLEAKTRAEAVARAVLLGLIEPSEAA